MDFIKPQRMVPVVQLLALLAVAPPTQPVRAHPCKTVDFAQCNEIQKRFDRVLDAELANTAAMGCGIRSDRPLCTTEARTKRMRYWLNEQEVLHKHFRQVGCPGNLMTVGGQ